jgi:hypothetical protein
MTKQKSNGTHLTYQGAWALANLVESRCIKGYVDGIGDNNDEACKAQACQKATAQAELGWDGMASRM